LGKPLTTGNAARRETTEASDKPPDPPALLHDLYPSHLATLSRTVLEQTVQRRAQTAYLGNGVVLARILTRYKMLLDANDRGFACHVMLDGFWEFWLTQFFARTIKPGMRVMDVGANYGYYTLLFADIVTESGRVLAVEPNPAAVALLRQTLRLNGFAASVDVLEYGLGANMEGTAMLVIPEGEPKNAHISTLATGPTCMVATTSIDRLVDEFGPVDLIKIDAEGSERDIITGMRQLLRVRPPALVLEFNAGRCEDPAALLNELVAIYGSPGVVGFDSRVGETSLDTLLHSRTGEDWILYFPAPGA
jgi:FkbM family methyltransferase